MQKASLDGEYNLTFDIAIFSHQNIIHRISHFKNVYPAMSVGYSAIIQNFMNELTLKPQDSFGRFLKFLLDLQKVDHTIRKHH